MANSNAARAVAKAPREISADESESEFAAEPSTEPAMDSDEDARAVLRLAVDAAEPDEDATVHEVHREVADMDASKRVATLPTHGSTTGGDFSFAADYSSLSGQLEYSRSSRQWKLRYIPIDGQTDDYGGSVLLGDSADLAQFKPGDHVSVRGSLAGGPSAGGSFSPRYRLDRVERLSR